MNRTKKLAAIVLCFCLVATPCLLGGTKDEYMLTVLEKATELFMADEKTPQKAYYLKSPDDSDDFVIVEFKQRGYAVFYKETMELLEYCPDEKSPYNKGAKKSYYTGPGGYYTKETDGYRHTLSNELTVIEDPASVSQAVRDLFDSPEDLQTTNSESIESVENIERNDEVHTGTVLNGTIDSGSPEILPDTNGTYIKNAWYFMNNPRHYTGDDAENDNTPKSKNGTCTVIASQLLLGYHNYFSDRRIIPTIDPDGSKTEFISDSFGALHLKEDRNALGTQDKFYEKLAKHIVNNPIGQSLGDAKSGITDYLKSSTPIDCYSNIHLNVQLSLLSDSLRPHIVEEINNNRPLLIGMNGMKVDSWHVVVCYGYRNYQNSFGYIVHYGWGSQYTHAWTNASWYIHCLTMATSHRHSHQFNGGAYHEMKCTICGQTEMKNAHTYNARYEPISRDDTSHYEFCSCGASRCVPHQYTYTKLNNTQHLSHCSLCDFTIYHEHFYKSSSATRCFFCE